MTTVCLHCTKDGAFFSCEASGHAGFDVAGKDIVCASVTAILRTAALVLSECDGITLEVDAKESGELQFCAKKSATCNAKGTAESGKTEMLRYAARFIRAGIKSIADEYPANLNFEEFVVEISD